MRDFTPLKSWENMRDDRMEALNKYLDRQRIREEKRSQGIEPDSESDDDNPSAMYKPEVKHKRKRRLRMTRIRPSNPERTKERPRKITVNNSVYLGHCRTEKTGRITGK